MRDKLDPPTDGSVENMQRARLVLFAILTAQGACSQPSHAAADAAAVGDVLADASFDGPSGDAPNEPNPHYLKASNTNPSDLFGQSIALSADGTTLAVSATSEASKAIGIDGNQSDNSDGYSGAVYVFVRTGATWVQQAYVKASNTDADDEFGWSISLSADGNTMAVGALAESSSATGIDGNQADNSVPSSGAVYIFERTGTSWSQQSYLKASNTGQQDEFGVSVALSSDGGTLAVGAQNESSNATGIDGDQTNNASDYSGAAYVFVRSGTSWLQQAYVKASNTGVADAFGVSVSLSGDGDTLAVGAWTEDGAAIGIDGDQTSDTAPDSGAVYVFSRDGSAWTQQAYVKASNTDAGDGFGLSVALSVDGSTLAVGAIQEDSAAIGVEGQQSNNAAPGSGAAYVFVRTGSTWAQQAYLKASNTEMLDEFGFSVALSADGNLIAIGSYLESSDAIGIGGDQSNNSARGAGAVYELARSGSAWSMQNYIKASNTGAGDGFGNAIALSGSGSTLAIGAFHEASAATGLDGNGADNSAGLSGAAYVFRE